jgi:hypothetical protein
MIDGSVYTLEDLKCVSIFISINHNTDFSTTVVIYYESIYAIEGTQ